MDNGNDSEIVADNKKTAEILGMHNEEKVLENLTFTRHQMQVNQRIVVKNLEV